MGRNNRLLHRVMHIDVEGRVVHKSGKYLTRRSLYGTDTVIVAMYYDIRDDSGRVFHAWTDKLPVVHTGERVRVIMQRFSGRFFAYNPHEKSLKYWHRLESAEKIG